MSPNVNGSPEENTHKNARLTPEGREHMVLAVVDCQLSKACSRALNFFCKRSSDSLLLPGATN
jgi:hypothetical protein